MDWREEEMKDLNAKWEEINSINAALREENDLQRQSIQDLSCQVTALREAATKAIKSGKYIDLYSLEQLLSSPDPGAKIKAVVDVCLKRKALANKWKGKENYASEDFIKAIYEMKGLDRQLNEALADLEGGTP